MFCVSSLDFHVTSTYDWAMFNNLRIDMKGKISSKWNNAIVDILLEKLLQKKADPEYWGDMKKVTCILRTSSSKS